MKTSSRSFIRHVAPVAPVALALLAQGGVLGGGAGTGAAAPTPGDTQPAVCGEGIADNQTCHSQYPTGCSAKAGYDGYLNYLKNQLIDPARTPEQFKTPADLVALDGQLPDGLAKNNHGDFVSDLAALGDGKIVALTGYLYYAQKGGTESSNCGLTAPEDIDFHIGIGPQALDTSQQLSAADKKSAVIVEMTPHWRAQYKPAWTLDLLHGALGRQVRVTGQMLVDNEHDVASDDCALEGHTSRCWRASVWELHPVTRFQVCGADSCTATDDAGWVDLESFQANAGGGATEPPSAGSAAAGETAAPAGAPGRRPRRPRSRRRTQAGALHALGQRSFWPPP
jgi:hypothetical protein